jgi:tRNA(Ile)-lysidine synthase
MPFIRDPHPSLRAPHAPILRPLIEVPRAAIAAYARQRKLTWVEDESNDDVGYTRNWLRREVLPRVAERVPSYRATLTRAAERFAETSALLDELAKIDAQNASGHTHIAVERLRSLTRARAANVLRHMIAAQGWDMPSSVQLGEALRQALSAKRDATVSVTLGACEVRRHAGAIHLLAARRKPRSSVPPITWRGERNLALSESGTLTMKRERGTGLSAARMKEAVVTIRRRRGGERLKTALDRPRRTLKNLLQESAVPPWQRERLPLIYCDDVLACVPGIGIEHAFRAEPGEPSIVPVWKP